MQHEILTVVSTWVSYFRIKMPGTVRGLGKRAGLVAMIVLVLALMVAAYGATTGAETVPVVKAATVAETVLCIGVVRDKTGMQHAFFQRAGDTLEQTLTAQGMAALVRDGFTVEHRNCYDSWQKAADWLTDGTVTLPDNATEQDFTTALLAWKQRR